MTTTSDQKYQKVSKLSKAVKGELANETVNYDAKTKVYVPIWARSASCPKRAVMVKFEKVSGAVVDKFSSK